MQNNQTGSPQAGNDHDRELRAAIDVMFEALSHIQASVNASEPEGREKEYRMFKEALYERFDHLLEQEYATDTSPDRKPEGGGAPTDLAEEEASEDRFDRPAREAGGDGAADEAKLDASEPRSTTPSTSGTQESGGQVDNAFASSTGGDQKVADQKETADTLWPNS